MKRLLLPLLALFLLGLGQGVAGAAEIEEPGPVDIRIDAGFVKLGSTPAQVLDTTDGGYGISGEVGADGSFSAPTTGFNFKPLSLVVTNSFGTFVYRVDLIPTHALSGEIDPLAQTVSVELRFKAKITLTQGGGLGDVGNACFVGSDQAPIVVTLSTAAPPSSSTGPGVSQGGREYLPGEGTARIADTTFMAPGQNGCSGLAGGALNAQIGLPAPSGKSAAEFEVELDPAPQSKPGIAIVDKPLDPTDERGAEFTFKSNLPDGFTFECRLDGGDWSPCQGGAGYTDLELGPHTFEVRATGPGGEAGPTRSFEWDIVESLRRVRPRLAVSPGTAGTGQAVTLDASGSQVDLGVKRCATSLSGPCGYRWDIDGDGAIDQSTDDPTLETTFFAPGLYRPRVTVVDIAGESGTAEAWLEIQETPRVLIGSGPPAVSASREAVFVFSLRSGPDLSRMECSLDGADFEPCVSGRLVRVSQAAGTRVDHEFSVRAVTPKGVTGPPATHRWTVDLAGQVQRPVVPSTSIATFNGTRLVFKVKCANRFSPLCLYRDVAAINGRGRKARPITSRARARARAGRARVVRINVKPRFRQKVRAMARSGKRNLTVRAKLVYLRNGKPRRHVVLVPYRVALVG